MIFREFNVVPNLPAKLNPLLQLAYNVWWAWDQEAFSLYRDINPDLWSEVNHNPVKFLFRASQTTLDSIANDEAFLNRVDTTVKRLEAYMTNKSWFDKVRENLPKDFSIAYFSLEFGLAECLPIYSGGLGVLAGDHLKSASDLGLPLAGVGLLYSQGYFQQYLTNDGWQQERYITHDYNAAPLKVMKNPDGSPVKLDLHLPSGTIKYQVWKVQVGRIPLYLLDTNLPENSQADRDITSKLYGGDLEMRIKQEFLLGIGGMMALTALNIHPTVTHMNEGHSSFLALERIRLLMQSSKMSFREAAEVTAASSVFTTHTPVPAGNDRFPLELMQRYLKDYVEKNLHMNFNDFFRMGRVNEDDENEWFCMTVLALKLSHFNNGVSRLHGRVSRDMWKDIWKGVPVDEVPITYITNGTHAASWISREISDLFTRYMGTKWIDNPEDQEVWQRVSEIPDTELWRTHERRRERLVAFVRRRLKQQLQERKAPAEDIDSAGEVLHPEALTIGFARRFATYKRANLIFSDIERLKKILNNPDKPVQFIFAGKAHPKDDAGKEFIKLIFHISEQPDFKGKIVFVEDYNLNTAHYLVQGVDVWMNNPRRPLEASGTSGMKVNFNGGMNFSVLDGWWDEKADADNGWSIGRGEEYEDNAYQDKVEANSLYETLENEIIPLYYKHGKDGLPHDWIKKMKISMSTLCPVFNTHRMVMEYAEKFYKPGGKNYGVVTASNFEKARNINKWKEDVAKKWGAVRITAVSSDTTADINVGGQVKVTATVETGSLSENDLNPEIYFGYDRADQKLDGEGAVAMKFKEKHGTSAVFEGVIKPTISGKVRYAVRVMPKHPDLPVRFMPGYIKWSEV